MAQETEPVAAPTTGAVEASPLESPSPKRRNRKKNRRGSTTGAEDDADGDEQETAVTVSPCVAPMGDVATADLISLPSPVAAVTTSIGDVFATLETTGMEQAMGELALTQDKMTVDTQVETTVKEDGLLKLPIHPSSGRIPRTPPSTPEPFLMHSPEKEQSKVAPLSPGLLSTVVETPADVEVAISAPSTETQVDEASSAQQEAAPVEDVATVEQVPDMVVEQEASVLSSSLAEMSLTNGSAFNGVFVEPEKPVETLEDIDVAVTFNEQPQSPVADDNVVVPLSLEANVNTISISSLSIDETTVPSAEATSPETASPIAPPSLMKTLEAAESMKTMEAAEPIPVVTLFTPEPAATETPKVIEPTVLEPVQAKVSKSTEEPTPAPTNGKNNTPPELSLFPRRNKRKGDSPETKLHTTANSSSLFAKARPVQPSSTNGDTSKAVPTDSLFESKLRPTKRKGDVSDVKPPPAPATIAAVPKEIRPKRLVARSNSGSTLHKAKTDPEAKLKSEVVARPVHDRKMTNPTASSIARASAAEARKALMKSAAAKKTPARQPMRTATATKSVIPAPTVPSAVEKSVIPPPAPAAVIDTDDSQRNVKRRLNATEAEAASRRLYEDAREAKARKDARRAELQETYTFAPQVNNFKRRTAPGEIEDPNRDRFSRLHAQAKELQEKKRGLQQQHEREGCTFAPTISARAKRLAQPGSGPRYENLYKNAQEIKQKREEKLLEKARTTEEQCPFKPKITASKSLVKTKPLYDSEREKQKRLVREQKKIEAEISKCTFKPKVSAKRMKSKAEGASDAVEAVPDVNPYNRLYQASIDRTERLQKLRQVRDEEEMAQAPFQPKITTRSRVLKAKAKTKEPFHKRLYNKDYMKRLDTEREQRRLEDEQQFSFKPEINEPPEEIKAKVNERASPRKTIFERLYDEKDKMKEKIEMSEELRLQKEMAECTFRPQIEADAVQGNGESAPPVWERLLSYDKAQVIEEREKMKEQLEMQECTFKPEVKSPDTLLMKNSQPNNVFDRLTASGSNSPLDPTRASFITQRPSSSPGRQSPDSKGVSIGRLIKLTKFSLPTERKKVSRANSISQPSSVNKLALQRSTSFSGPKSAASSPTSTADILSTLAGSRQVDATVTENYQSWSAELDAKLRHL